MKTLLLNVNGVVSFVDCKDLDDMYAMIGCRTIDIVRRASLRPGGIDSGMAFDLIVDDDGLDDKTLALNALGMWYFGVAIVGNILIAECDEATGDRLPYSGPFLNSIRPEPGFGFAMPDGPTPTASGTDGLHRTTTE